MGHGSKKPISQSADKEVLHLLEGMSKAALADLVIDLLRQSGRELPGCGTCDAETDGEHLAAFIADAVTPVLVARGDPMPDSRTWFYVRNRGKLLGWYGMKGRRRLGPWFAIRCSDHAFHLKLEDARACKQFIDGYDLAAALAAQEGDD